MRSIRASSKPRLFAGAVAVVGLLVVTLVQATPASGQSGGASTSALTDGGVLALHLGSSGTPPQDYFGFRAPNGLGGYEAISTTQSITNGQGCKIALTGAPNQLVTFTPTGGSNPNTGFVGDSIGVVSSGEGNGQPCGRFDKPPVPSQTLTMNLGSALNGKMIDYAEIDLELKFSAAVRVTGLLDGVPVLTQDYQSVGSDSGPDSGDGDNYRVRFPKLQPACGACKTTVNGLKFEISSPSGGASLEGGSDGTQPCDVTDPGECGGADPAHPEFNFSLGQTLGANTGTFDTLFHLLNADGALNCGDSATQTNAGITTTVQRLDNAGGGTCTPIPYNQDSSTTCTLGFLQCIFLQKDLSGQQAQFYWTVTWAPETGSYMETETQFDFGAGFVNLQLCRADGLAGNGLDGNPDLPANGDPWCVVDTSTTHLISQGPGGETLVQVTERYYGLGDPGGHR